MEKRFYPAVGETVWYTKLPNGLPIYVVPKPEFGKQFAFFAVNYGGMDLRFRLEDGHWQDTPAGVAHFLEHKMFDTEDGNALQIMAANGADPNAFTSPTVTGYYFEATEGFEKNLESLLSFVSVPYFTPESVEKEQGIIAQEIRMGEDDPDTALYYMLLEALYEKHPIRVKVVGSEESISTITSKTLYDCHRAFYTPGNMVLCVAGNVTAEQVADVARRVLPEQRGTRAEREAPAGEGENAHLHRLEREMEVSAPQFLIGFKGEAPEQEKWQYQQLLAALVCDTLFSPSAPLYTKLYEEGLINSSFDSGFQMAQGCACLSIGGESRDPEAVFARVMEEVERVNREGIDPALWERQKKAAYGSLVRRLNSLEDTCIELAMCHFEGGEYLRFPEIYQQIRREDGETLIRRWCTAERSAMAVIRPRT